MRLTDFLDDYFKGNPARRPGVAITGSGYHYDGYESKREADCIYGLHTPAPRPEATW